MTRIRVIPSKDQVHRGLVLMAGKSYPCAIGKAGATISKREGDKMSPIGLFPLRRLYYRPDVYDRAPETGLETRPIAEDDGWCDAPDHPDYNRPVKRPFPASHEKMWREDGLYDLVVEIGWNDRPPVSGGGSAIFMHIARPGFEGTEGCVALRREDLLEILAALTPESMIEIGV